MEYMILNEESIPFSSIVPLPFLISLIDSGWYNLPLTDNYYMRNWIESQNIDYKRQLKTIIDKTVSPQIPVDEIETNNDALLSEFSLESNCEIQTPSLGVAVLLDQLAISFKSNSYWDYSEINLIRQKLNSNAEIIKNICIVKNATQFTNWQKHLKIINLERKENLRKGSKLWENRETEFVNLIFCQATKKQFQQFNFNNSTYNRLWENLTLLNDNISKCSNNSEFKKITKLNFSDESDSVKNNPKLSRYREFTLPNDNKEFFGLHVKNFPGAMRLHFIPDYSTNKIFIGYFGKHLPT